MDSQWDSGALLLVASFVLWFYHRVLLCKIVLWFYEQLSVSFGLFCPAHALYFIDVALF